MRTVLHLVPDLGPNSHAQQIALLAPRLPRDRFRVQVANFHDSDFFRGPLYAADIPVFVLGPPRPFAPVLWISLRRLLAQQRPDVIHAWGWPALRLAVTATLGRRVPIVASDTTISPRTAWFDRWCFRRANRVVLPTGKPDEHTTIIPFAVETPANADRTAWRRKLDIPTDVPVFAIAGTLSARYGWREALQVFDILSHVWAETWLLVAGDGPDAPALTEFVGKLGLERVRCLGWRRDLPAELAAADALFVFGERGGRSAALQALAAGTPVVAWRRPDLVELLGDAAIFVERGDLHSCATAVRQLIEKSDRRHEIVARGRALSARLAPEIVVQRWVEVYGQ